MTVKEIFDTMDYGPAPESAGDALAWIVDQGSRFGMYINGDWTAARGEFHSRNPANGETLADLTQAIPSEIDDAVAAARAAQPGWAGLGGHGRARYLYAIARLLQKHSRLFAVLETLDNGKPIRESRDIDIPLAQRHFYYHAGMAQLMAAELPGREAHGVCGQIIPWNFPLLMLAWKIAPALAAGNTVVLKPAEYTSLTALLFADICTQAGLPRGVVNIVTGDGEVGEALVSHPGIDKVAFTGSTPVGRAIRTATAGSGKALTLELGGKSPYIVFEDADIDSAIEGLVDAIWFNQGQVCCAGSRLIVQEGIAETFHSRLRARMDKLRMGNPLDKCIDVGAIVDPVQLQTISKMVDSNTSGEIYRANVELPSEGCFYPPTLITGLHPSDALMQDEIFGPVLVGTTFRHPGRGGADRQQHPLWPGRDAVEREHQCRARHRAQAGRRSGLDQRHQHVRRRRRLWRRARERFRPRRWLGRHERLYPAGRQSGQAGRGHRLQGRRRPQRSARPHRQALCRRQAGAARRRLFARRPWPRGRALWGMSAWPIARMSGTPSRPPRARPPGGRRPAISGRRSSITSPRTSRPGRMNLPTGSRR